MFLTFEAFHFEISGNEDIDLQPLNILLISLIFEVLHFDISDNEANDSQL